MFLDYRQDQAREPCRGTVLCVHSRFHVLSALATVYGKPCVAEFKTTIQNQKELDLLSMDTEAV